MSDEFEKIQAHPSGEIARAGFEVERPAGLVEIAGRVKWFDVGKGYGFIVPDSGEADVLIHVTVLRRDGFSTLFEGAQVVAEAQRRERGLQVFRVLAVSPGEGPPPPSTTAARTRTQATSVAPSRSSSSSGSTAPAVLASLPAAKARKTFSSTWRRCVATAS